MRYRFFEKRSRKLSNILGTYWAPNRKELVRVIEDGGELMVIASDDFTYWMNWQIGCHHCPSLEVVLSEMKKFDAEIYEVVDLGQFLGGVRLFAHRYSHKGSLHIASESEELSFRTEILARDVPFGAYLCDHTVVGLYRLWLGEEAVDQRNYLRVEVNLR